METKVLDHGFVRLRNISGPTRRTESPFDAHDVDPANSARMSFNNMDKTRRVEQDYKLAEYLLKNMHTTPFEMIIVWLEMKLPIFVARQFVRHRTVSINEVSGRYITLPAEWYVPEKVGGTPQNAKQGQADGLDDDVQNWFRDRLDHQCRLSYVLYSQAIDAGVAAEHARLMLHLNHYTHWLWKQDLHNLMHFLALRNHSHAQIEAQLYAKAIDGLLRSALPHTMDLFDKYMKVN